MNGAKSRSISEVIRFIQKLKEGNLASSKDQIASATAKVFDLKLTRKVYHCPEFSIRFSTAKGSSFSNTVLSLSALASYDQAPFILCIVRPREVEFLLVNSSFLRKISHSSHQLRVDNVKGSFLGHDILREFEGLRNCPDNFDKLFAMHVEFTWEENLLRLVEATTAIVPTGVRFDPSAQEATNIVAAGSLANRISGTPDYLRIEQTLAQIVFEQRNAILQAATIDNINERGNAIEQIITRTGNVHGIHDLLFDLPGNVQLLVDVKTKLVNLTSSPKAYNVDKCLETLAAGNKILSFFFIGIDSANQITKTRLVSVLDGTILKATRIQFHWAGRNSRGVTQLTGDLSSIFDGQFREAVNVADAEKFLHMLIEIHK